MPPFLTSPTLSHPSIAHGFFGRAGGVSAGLYASLNLGRGSKDDATAVEENRARVLAAMGGTQLCTLHQVHSAQVVKVSGSGFQVSGREAGSWNLKPETSPPEADALVTATRGIALGILTADCGPVLFADPQAGVIGAAHAGWKGALYGVLENTLAAMESLGASRSNICAAIGPCIAQASYEVGPEFRARFVEVDAGYGQFFEEVSGSGFQVPGKEAETRNLKPETHSHFNLPAFIAHRLHAAGLVQVACLHRDTCAEEENFFSYRRSTLRSEPDYGRQVSAICLTE